MTRSIWKPISNYLQNNDKKSFFFPRNIRRAVILDQHVGKKVSIHKGSSRLYKVRIKDRMVGFKFGQLCLTKRKVIHQIKKKKKK